MSNVVLGTFIEFCKEVSKTGKFNFKTGGGDWVDATIEENKNLISFWLFCENRIKSKPKVKTIPLEYTDIKPSTIIRQKASYDGLFTRVLSTSVSEVYYAENIGTPRLCSMTYEYLMKSSHEYSNDNGKTWHKCEKEAPNE